MIKKFIPPGKFPKLNIFGAILNLICFLIVVFITIGSWYFWIKNPTFNLKLISCIINSALSIFFGWVIFKYLIRIKINQN